MMCSNCSGEYEDPDVTAEVKAIEARKPWRRDNHQPRTFFETYHSRLHAMAVRHGVPSASLKALIEDAFGKCDTPPAAQESEQALRKLAKMKVRPAEINWLFQYHIIPERPPEPPAVEAA